MNRVELLASIPMFEGLDEFDLVAIADELRVIQLVPGDVVFNAGDNGDSMYIVAKGIISIYIPSVDPSSRIELASLGTGSCFGEIALFDDKPRSASAQAICDTVVLRLGKNSFVRCIESRPSVAIGIIKTESELLRNTNAMLRDRDSRIEAGLRAKKYSWSERIADVVSAFNGSWTFLIIVFVLTVVWSVLNIPGFVTDPPPDEYPYIFYNLVVAVFIAVQWPLIVMSQNRKAKKERREAEQDYKVNLNNETNCELLLSELREFRREWEGREEELVELLSHSRLSMLPPIGLQQRFQPQSQANSNPHSK